MRKLHLWALAGTVVFGMALVGSVGSAPAKAERASANPAVTASNALAFDLYRKLAADAGEKPLFFSPYSISTALVIVAEGARSETAAEMGQTLGLPAGLRRAGGDERDRPWDLEPVHAGLSTLNKQFEAAGKPFPPAVLRRLTALRKELDSANKAVISGDLGTAEKKAQKLADEINRLQQQGDRYELRVANALWAEKSFPFRQTFLDVISKFHGTNGAFPADFRTKPDAERRRINAWVEEQTRDRIKDLIPSGAIDPLTRLAVTNAVYFKGQWKTPFAREETKDQPFTLADGKKRAVPTMHGYLSDARYAAFEKDGTFFETPAEYEFGTKDFSRFYPGPGGFQVLDLPYKGGDLSMLVLAPRSPDGLPALEKLLTAGNLQKWAGKLAQRKVDAYVPKFRMEASFDLGKTLQGLGMKRAFTNPGQPDGAQFDGMSDSSRTDEKLYITQALHKAFVEVNEQGTEAAAATAVLIGALSAPVTSPFTPTLRADRPFVFLIRDQKSGCVLFVGRVLDPKAGG